MGAPDVYGTQTTAKLPQLDQYSDREDDALPNHVLSQLLP